MVKSAQQLLNCIKPCISLFAQLWQMPTAAAESLCQDGVRLMADKLAFTKPSYHFCQKLQDIFAEPITLGMLARLKPYALPPSFFGKHEQSDWHKWHPNDKNHQLLGWLGILLLWLYRHNMPTLCLGQPISLPRTSKLTSLTKFYTAQKAWLVVGLFLLGLGLTIWQALPTPAPKDLQTKAKSSKQFYDIAIVRIDGE